ncbi:MAG: ATP-dependent Clp protease ATP-binding subunit [Candidatus Aenigmatarchaeota archaeon]
MEKAKDIIEMAKTIAVAKQQQLSKEHIIDVSLKSLPDEYFIEAGVKRELLRDLRVRLHEKIKSIPKAEQPEKIGKPTEELEKLFSAIFKFSEPDEMSAEEFIVIFLNLKEVYIFNELENIAIKIKYLHNKKREEKEKEKEKEKVNVMDIENDEPDVFHDEDENKTLKSLTRNITELARKNLLPRAHNREKIINKILIAINRKTKPNVLLVGNPGVGKTAIVEELAYKLLSDLPNYKIYELRIADLVSGSTYRGQFEKKLTTLMKELEKMDNVILFIDEIHTVIGAGDGQGATSAESILKPYLARGNIKLIGATTFTEAEKIYRDKAFARRFVKIKVDEPSKDETLKIIKSIIIDYSKEHNVKYKKGVEDLIYSLAKEYMPSRYFPDKAVDIVDIAGAIAKIKKYDVVDENIIYEAVSELTNIDLAILKADESLHEKISKVEKLLKQKVLYQDQALDLILKRIKDKLTGKINKPLAMIFTGPTGVGKTYTAKTLSELLEFPMLKLDMSNYYDRHTISSLIGSPAGYVGSDKDGILTGFIKEHPVSIVILDEMEKAHPNVYNLLLAALDGEIKNMMGETISTKKTIFILTSNLISNTRKNIGFEKVKNSKDDFLKFIPPEILRRIDEIIEFKKIDVFELQKT